MEYMSQTWRIFFEAVPVAIAFFIVIIGIFKAVIVQDREQRIVSWMFVLSATLLIFAQSSWTWTIFIKKDLLGSEFANFVWTAFNSITMGSMLYALKGFKK